MVAIEVSHPIVSSFDRPGLGNMRRLQLGTYNRRSRSPTKAPCPFDPMLLTVWQHTLTGGILLELSPLQSQRMEEDTANMPAKPPRVLHDHKGRLPMIQHKYSGLYDDDGPAMLDGGLHPDILFPPHVNRCGTLPIVASCLS